MNKIANVVYSGWMVKSPPEKKFRLTGAWKIFRAVSAFLTVLSLVTYHHYLQKCLIPWSFSCITALTWLNLT